MRQRLRSHLTYANVMSTIAVFLVLGGSTAIAAFVVDSNSDVASNTISGHKPPTGKHANIIGGSVNSTDLASQAVTPAKLKAPEAWHNVGAGSTTQDLCEDPSRTAVFCSDTSGSLVFPWTNFGGGFATAGFYKDQLGIAHLKGVVAQGFAEGPDARLRNIFRLPTAYRPSNRRAFPSLGRNSSGQEVAQGRVDVLPDGRVILISDCVSGASGCSATGGYVTLDAVSFRPDG